MVSRFAKTILGLMLLAAASGPSGAATLTPQIRPPAQFRIDFTRPGGMPGAPRDIAAARDFGSTEVVEQGPVRHKRKPRAH